MALVHVSSSFNPIPFFLFRVALPSLEVRQDMLTEELFLDL